MHNNRDKILVPSRKYIFFFLYISNNPVIGPKPESEPEPVLTNRNNGDEVEIT